MCVAGSAALATCQKRALALAELSLMMLAIESATTPRGASIVDDHTSGMCLVFLVTSTVKLEWDNGRARHAATLDLEAGRQQEQAWFQAIEHGERIRKLGVANRETCGVSC